MRKCSPDSKLGASNPLNVEPLESRLLLSTTITTRGTYDIRNIPINTPTSAVLSNPKHGPMANVDNSLLDLYLNFRRFQKQGGTDTSYAAGNISSVVLTKGKYVGVTVRGRTDLESLTDRLRLTGGQIVYRSGKYNAIDAIIPISQLHDLAVDPTVATINALSPPQTSAQQGSANNQAVEAEKTDQVTTQYGLDGTGVKVGVISNSVDQALGGIAASQATGDLPEKGVQVIEDEFPQATPVIFTGADDEGRAMLELIHDIAPGADLAFATAGFSQMQMADNIRKLRAAGSDVIVDDIAFFNDSFFQPGIIDQAIHDVTADGATYLSSAGNFAQAGYEAPTNFVTIDGVRYVDFDPGPGVQTKLRVNFPAFIPIPGAPNIPSTVPIVLQWDNPYNGVVGSASTDLDVYAYDIHRPNRIVASGTANNIKTGIPLEQVLVPANSVDIQIRVADSLPGRALPTRFKLVAQAGGTQISTPFPENERAVFGHNGGPDTISVGAVPFSNAPPFATAGTSIASEDFSSVGPVTQIFDADGNRLNSPQTLNKPDISGIDRVNTSFFTGSGFTALPGQTDSPDDPDVLPNFSGTSAAAPDVAGLVALLKQAAPNATQAQILSALQATAQPVNGAPIGTWDPKGGFGLVDGLAAAQQFVTHPTVHIDPISPDPSVTAVDSVKIVFNQQVTGFDISDLILQLDGGPNLLSGGNNLTTTDGGRTYILSNLSTLTADAGNYTLTLDDFTPTIQNLAGLDYNGGPVVITWTKLPPPARPIAPSDLKTKVISDTEVRLRWTDNDGSEQGFTVQRAEDEGFTTGVKNFTADPNTSVFTDTAILPTGKTYFYRVRAFNRLANRQISSWSNVASATTLSPGEIILDNESSSGVSVSGSWTTSSEVPGFFGSSYLDDGNSAKGHKSVLYRPNFELEGDYYVYTRWTRATDRATNVPIDVVDASGGKTTVTVNERDNGGNGWVLLGKFHFKQGAFGSVTIRNGGTNGKVIADAVRFLSASAITPIPPTQSA